MSKVIDPLNIRLLRPEAVPTVVVAAGITGITKYGTPVLARKVYRVTAMVFFGSRCGGAGGDERPLDEAGTMGVPARFVERARRASA